MKVNSAEALVLGRKALAAYGNNWSKVRAAGKPGKDGVIVIRLPKPTPSDVTAEKAGK